VSEGIESGYRDIINYAAFALIKLDSNEKWIHISLHKTEVIFATYKNLEEQIWNTLLW
jgi:hypothetical protein